MKTLFILLTSLFLTVLSAEEALAAIKYKRFPACPEGSVTAKTCEGHGGQSARYHFCHAGNTCDTSTGKCHK